MICMLRFILKYSSDEMALYLFVSESNDDLKYTVFWSNTLCSVNIISDWSYSPISHWVSCIIQQIPWYEGSGVFQSKKLALWISLRTRRNLPIICYWKGIQSFCHFRICNYFKTSERPYKLSIEWSDGIHLM